jgi:hypothetical protein
MAFNFSTTNATPRSCWCRLAALKEAIEEAVEEALRMTSLNPAKFLSWTTGSAGLRLDTEPIWSC